MAQGYVKLDRGLLEKHVFKNEKLLKVWIWCLLKATHKPHEETVGLQKIQLQPGQFVTGRFAAATELRMSPSTFWNNIISLRNSNSIQTETNNKFTLVTLVNWGFYQDKKYKSGQQNDSKITANGQQNNTNNNGNNDKNEKKEDTIPFSEIIDHLNKATDAKYKHTTKTTREHIQARWNEGWRLADFQAVIDKKAREWKGTSMEKFLRPETLFGTKFEGYLNQPEGGPPHGQARGTPIANSQKPPGKYGAAIAADMGLPDVPG